MVAPSCQENILSSATSVVAPLLKCFVTSVNRRVLHVTPPVARSSSEFVISAGRSLWPLLLLPPFKEH